MCLILLFSSIYSFVYRVYNLQYTYIYIYIFIFIYAYIYIYIYIFEDQSIQCSFFEYKDVKGSFGNVMADLLCFPEHLAGFRWLKTSHEGEEVPDVILLQSFSVLILRLIPRHSPVLHRFFYVFLILRWIASGFCGFPQN